ncbi:MAG: DsrE family protein [Rubrivivax sp.]|nr:DsrE family protein [Rubrivivax sp.]
MTSSSWMLIESRDPFAPAGGGWCTSFALALAAAGQPASVMLVNNGVFAARRGARTTDLARLHAAGVPVFADSFSLAERGIGAARLAPGVSAAPLDVVVERLLDGTRVLWH